MSQLILTATTTAFSALGGAGVGQALASTAASTIAGFAANTASSLIFGPSRRRVEGPRLDSFQVQASTEGAPIIRVFGRARISGQVIWAANFNETITEETQGGKGGRIGSQTTTVNYLYSISLAIGLCEGPISRIGRVWADGRPFDLSAHQARIYLGEENQNPDGVIEAIEGSDRAPAFRGLSYIVFEDLPLTDFGNRIPQFSFEVEKSLHGDDENTLEQLTQAMTIIPSSGEFVYGITPVSRTLSEGVHIHENVNNNQGGTDFTASMTALTSSLPNIAHGSLIVAWFGNDLRANHCLLQPGVETRDKENSPYTWQVGDVSREEAYEISRIEGDPSYGGTPADRTVIEALRDLHARGLQIMFHPFILMDIPANNQLPGLNGGQSQPAFPWRGRIGMGETDQSAAAISAIDHFFGTAKGSDFQINGEVVSYHGAPEWSFRRMILHYAHLCKLSGVPIEAFLLGSELRGITTTRDGNDFYPAIVALIDLADEVRAILGPDTQLSYGADWSEYFGHQLSDGSASRYFHLDPFWAHHNVNFIGIDYYMPLSDWRPGFAHLDAREPIIEEGQNGPYGIEYLQANLRGGEGYDWFYANEEERNQQNRTPITDGAYGEDWVFRYKDLWNWWDNQHFDRPGGVRLETPTPWIPQSKPFRFTELGCPAINNGAAQPNVFVDAKSTENAFPYFSNGQRDDLAQRRLLEAHGTYWRDPGNNPVSSLYGGPMVDPVRTYIYAWDARPYPDFPARSDVWGDTDNWALGHWLTGRVGRAPLDLLVANLANEVGFTNVDTTGLDGLITGYVVDRPLSPRETIDPLADVYQFDMVETGDIIRFQSRSSLGDINAPKIIDTDIMVVQNTGGEGVVDGPVRITMGHMRDLPSSFRLGFIDESAEFTPAIAQARDPGLRSARAASREIPAVLDLAEAEARVRSLLADAWIMRTRIEFSLPPSYLTVEAGDVISVTIDNLSDDYRITEINDGEGRRVEAVRLSPPVYDAPQSAPLFQNPGVVPPALGPADWDILDLPYFEDISEAGKPMLAAFSQPWPGGIALYRNESGRDILAGMSAGPAIIGRLLDPVFMGRSGRWLEQSIRIRINGGTLSSREELDVLAGANALAIEAANGQFEILQFQYADLIGDNEWRVSRLLRGQLGTEAEAAMGAASGDRVIVLGEGGVQSGGGINRSGIVSVNFPRDLWNISFDWRAGPQNERPDHAAYTTKAFTYQGRNLRPISPVHLRWQRTDNGIKILWIRRTRIGGDGWEREEVPLGEVFERYRVVIKANNVVLRSIETDVPFYIYNDQLRSSDIADFMAQSSSSTPIHLTAEVAQLSDEAGLGLPSLPIGLPIS